MHRRNIKVKNKIRHGKRKRWDAILSRLPVDKKLIGAEVGVWQGKTSSRLLAQRPLLTLYMIDPWVVPAKDSSYWKSGDDNARKNKQAHERDYRTTLKKVKFAGDRAKIMRMTSQDAADLIPDGSLDFVFVDGNHSYEGVKLDIMLWTQKIKKGGFLSGHDLNHPRLPGVSKAVYEMFDKNKVIKDDNRTWFVKI